MKKLFIIPVLLMMLFVSSCSKNDSDLNFATHYTYVTIREASDTEDGLCLELDSEDRVYVEENLSLTDLSSLAIGERVVVGVSFNYSEIAGYEYSVNLFIVTKVIEGETVFVDSSTENNLIGNDEMSLYSNMSLTYGYFNIYARYTTADYENVKFSLVNLTYESNAYEDYLSMELRYDNGDDTNILFAEEYENYISFDMSYFRDLLGDKSGIVLKVNLETGGSQYITIESDELY
ncbi:MAG: NigD-like C-terminal domain-containing protein [Rikenellaceae bacterium]